MHFKTVHTRRVTPFFMLMLLCACCARTSYAVPEEVKIPIPVPCHAAPVPEPDWNIPHLAANADAVTQVKAELADLDLSKGYIAQLRAALSGCG